jgi:hypothetical protein
MYEGFLKRNAMVSGRLNVIKELNWQKSTYNWLVENLSSQRPQYVHGEAEEAGRWSCDLSEFEEGSNFLFPGSE